MENAPKRYYRVIDWKQERPKLFDLLVELETAEKMNAMQQCVVIWRNDAPYVLVNGDFARNAANLANYMAAGNVPAETVFRAQRGEDMNLTLDGNAVAELFSPVAAVVRLEDLNINADELERVLDAAPPTNRTRLYDLVMSLSDDEIVPALTVLRSMRMNRKYPPELWAAWIFPPPTLNDWAPDLVTDLMTDLVTDLVTDLRVRRELGD